MKVFNYPALGEYICPGRGQIYKDVENEFRGPLVIHTSEKVDKAF